MSGAGPMGNSCWIVLKECNSLKNLVYALDFFRILLYFVSWPSLLNHWIWITFLQYGGFLDSSFVVENIRRTIWITELLTQPIWIWVTRQATLSCICSFSTSYSNLLLSCYISFDTILWCHWLQTTILLLDIRLNSYVLIWRILPYVNTVAFAMSSTIITEVLRLSMQHVMAEEPGFWTFFMKSQELMSLR